MSIEPDPVHDIDPHAAVDVTGDEIVDAWRGVKAEDEEQVEGGLAGLLRTRSRSLLGDLVHPHRRSVIGAALLVSIATAARLAVPWLIQIGIDDGIPPLRDGGSGSLRPLVLTVIGLLFATLVAAITYNKFLLVLGRVGQDVVLDIRRRLFLHFQRLSTAFHERYTSGRVISRQTSDVEAIADLLGDGLINLVISACLLIGIGIALLLLDWRLALVTLAAFPVLFLMTRWFRTRAEHAYRATREAVALVIVHFVESLGG
ncbi:MAG: ABC transporter transmembrane domain-containing protein, partial [Acidimicrobiia bacterium]